MMAPVPYIIPPPQKPTREYSQNLFHMIYYRELGWQRQFQRGRILPADLFWEREFQKCFPPNLTIINVTKPLSYLRKFTPDGKLLLALSADQRRLEIYKYKGIAKVENLLAHEERELLTPADEDFRSLNIRQTIFGRILKLKWRLHLITEIIRCHLHREFSIFLDNGNFVLLASTYLSSRIMPQNYKNDYPDIYEICEPQNYRFYLIDLRNGTLTDIIAFTYDNIVLSHNHGVSAYGNTIAVFSKMRQCIDLISLEGDKLIPLSSIAAFGSDVDRTRFYDVFPTPCTQYAPRGLQPLSHLKQRILAYLYNKALKPGSRRRRKYNLEKFYKFFGLHEHMLLAKIQLVDEDTLLLRFEPNHTELTGEFYQSEFKLHVFYSISTQEVIRLFTGHCISVLHMLRDYCDTFRNVYSQQTGRPSSSPSNNLYFRALFDRAISCMSTFEATERYNTTLPLSTQSFTTTPYLDFGLFNYDEHLISPLDRPKVCSSVPIRFVDRNTSITKYRLYLETRPNPNPDQRELVAFIFHPFEPFAISLQKLSSRYVLNFHIYNRSTVVREEGRN